MKKKLVLMFICAITLLNLCGCGNKENKENEENSVFGTYLQTNYKKDGMIDGELTLYKNGSCAWVYWSISVLSGEYDVSKAERTYCSYDYIDDEVVITYTSYSSNIPIETTCKYNNNIINCGSRGTFEKE